MANNFYKQYKVEKSNIEKSYEYQLGLKNNEDYQNKVSIAFIYLAQFFKKLYPNVRIEPPRGREKSNRSLKIKIEKMEIERLCKLYAMDEITQDELSDLYNLINKNISKEQICGINIENTNTLQGIDEIMQKDIEEHIKTAILRIIYAKSIKENNTVLQSQVENNYGRNAVRRTGQLKDDLLKWNSIEEIDDEKLRELHNPFECLKVKDLLGFKFVIVDIPMDFQTDNKELQKLLNERKSATKQNKMKYDEMCCNELAKDFAKQIMNNEEMLKKLQINVIPNGYKHKQKQNGYTAEHIKFSSESNPEYMFELQLRSIHCENNSKVNGEAAHDKRPGKKRIFPSLKNRTTFIRELREIVPRYVWLSSEDGYFKIHKCNLAENAMEYFLGYINMSPEEYDKSMEYIREYEEKYKK